MQKTGWFSAPASNGAWITGNYLEKTWTSAKLSTFSPLIAVLDS